jgi:hypothetical protein
MADSLAVGIKKDQCRCDPGQRHGGPDALDDAVGAGQLVDVVLSLVIIVALQCAE